MNNLDNLIAQIGKRWSGQKRKNFLFSDSFGHYWTLLIDPKELTPEQKSKLVKK